MKAQATASTVQNKEQVKEKQKVNKTEIKKSEQEGGRESRKKVESGEGVGYSVREWEPESLV